MVAFRRKRKSSTRKNKGRTRRTVRRASTRKRKRANPKRRRTVSRGTQRPRLTYKGKNGSLIKRGSGTRINPKRRKRSRGRVRRNPAGIKGVQKMFSQKVLMSTATAGAGIAIGFAAMPIFYKILPEQLKAQRRWLGGIHLALGLGLAGFIRNKNAKNIGMVIAATGVYDLIAMNVDFLGLPPLRTTSALAENLIPSPAAPTSAPAEAASGCYGGQLDISHYGSSYPTAARPVSPVAATGVGASFERMGSSYPSLAYPTVGLSDDMAWDDMIN